MEKNDKIAYGTMLVGSSSGYLIGGHWGGTVAAVCLVFGIFLLSNAHWPRKQKNTDKPPDKPRETDRRTESKQEQKKLQDKEVPRIYLGKDVTPKFLSDMHRKNTTIQADKLSEDYVGKWLRISGRVGDISLLDFHKGPQIYVTVYLPRKAKTREEFDMVQLYFDNAKWGDRVNSLGRGHEINAIGKVAHIDFLGVRLEDCELE